MIRVHNSYALIISQKYGFDQVCVASAHIDSSVQDYNNALELMQLMH